jgi:hypothetical protein
MCFSAEASFTAAAVLVPAGVLGLRRAYQTDRRYLAFAALPVYFGLQQLFEGFVWTGGVLGNAASIEAFAMGYMFFAWLAWPVWVPFSAYFLEPCKRRHVYLLFSIVGAVIGAMQFFPYFAHENWLIVRFLRHAISYEGTVLFDFIMRREATYALYLFVVIAPLVSSSNPSARTFGFLIIGVVVVVFVFFQFAYISAFCFGGALMSAYILYTVYRPPALLTPPA